MKLDVLDLITPDPKWAAVNGLNMGSHVMWTYRDSQKLVYIKGPNGSPWDWYQWDEDYIRILFTENTWGNPATAKVQYGTGVPRYPRYIDYSPDQGAPAMKQFNLTPPRTNYLILNADGSCAASSNGNVTCKFYGPLPGPDVKDSKGNILLPAGVDWVSEYWRAGAMEKLTHRAPVGRYKWEQFDKNGQLTASSYPISITNATCPTPVQAFL